MTLRAPRPGADGAEAFSAPGKGRGRGIGPSAPDVPIRYDSGQGIMFATTRFEPDPSRTDTGADFIGSILIDFDENGDFTAERRYKPYGELLAGTATTYGWTGNTGSRATLLQYAEQYNRRRHYSTKLKQWTTSGDTRSPYNYSRPLVHLAPHGSSPHKFCTGCGDGQSVPECQITEQEICNQNVKNNVLTELLKHLIGLNRKNCQCKLQFAGSLHLEVTKGCFEYEGKLPLVKLCKITKKQTFKCTGTSATHSKNCRDIGKDCKNDCLEAPEISYKKENTAPALSKITLPYFAGTIKLIVASGKFKLDGMMKISTCKDIKACIPQGRETIL